MRALRGFASLTLCAAALALLPTVATAALVLGPGDVRIEYLDAAGKAETRAGAHPDRLHVAIEFGDDGVWEDPRDVNIDLPPGFAGELNGLPLCGGASFYVADCSNTSWVGYVTVPHNILPANPLYAVEPDPNHAAVFGGGVFRPVPAYVEPRADGNGISVHVTDLVAPATVVDLPISYLELELWGVPADHQELPDAPRTPILSLASRCDGPPPTLSVEVDTWQRPGVWTRRSADTGRPQTGCAQVPFDPSATLSLGSTKVDTPSGAEVSLAIPHETDPDGRASSQLKAASVALPEGMAISPGGAAGLSACTDAQFDLEGEGDPACPDSSVAGTVEARTPATPRPMRGRIFLGESHGSDRFRLLIWATGPGLQLKTVATLRPDPVSGRLVTNMTDLPEIPLEALKLGFDGGEGALLATPARCGTATLQATLTPYSGTAPQLRNSAVEIGGCPARLPFAPGFSAGSADARAGQATAFLATLTRRDGEQLPERLEIELPPGAGTALGSVDPCAEGAAASGACPASSRIGSASAKLGPGPQPARLGGDVYLTGPYRKAPFGVAIAFRGQIGPFDLGTAVVRGTIAADPLSGQVTVTTDPLPSAIEGVPMRLQSLGLDIDRPGFIHNPTSCKRTEVGATVRSTEGARARVSTPFAARGCLALPFKPRFGLALKGARKDLRKGGRPGLEISGRLPAGNANIGAADVSLPRLLRFDSGAVDAICSRRDALSGRCGRAAEVGTASAQTPLLDGALSGKIYAVQPEGDGTPDVWTYLHGSGIDVILQGQTTVVKGATATKLTDLPDFSLSSFTQRFRGGESGVFQLRRKACGRVPLADVAITGQNGVEVEQRAKLRVSGCGR